MLLSSDTQSEIIYHELPFEVDEHAIGEDLIRLDKSFFSQLLTHYFLPQAKKTATFDQRMRNAMQLLVEADEQGSQVISLSLCFSAIEAMVCEKSEGIVDELSRHVASLLEPIGLNRPDAIQGAKKLYNVRSKVLHGDSLVGTDSDYWAARMLAAAVLKAAIEWRTHVERMGQAADRADFLSELKTISATGGQMVGVDPKLSRFLPKAR